jgi:SRSO17 transposase
MKKKPKVVAEKVKEVLEAPPPESVIFSYMAVGDEEKKLRALQEEKLKKWLKKKFDEIT